MVVSSDILLHAIKATILFMPRYADHEFSAFSGKELVVRLERGGS